MNRPRAAHRPVAEFVTACHVKDCTISWGRMQGGKITLWNSTKLNVCIVPGKNGTKKASIVFCLVFKLRKKPLRWGFMYKQEGEADSMRKARP